MDFKRITRLLTNPQAYWNEAVGEPGDIRTLLVPQMLILAAIPALAGFLGVLLSPYFSYFPYFSYWPHGSLVARAIVRLFVSYGLNIGAWILLGVVINSLAEHFGAQKDFGQAMKLATGAVIPPWLGSALFVLSPNLGLLGAVAGLIYGAYILRVGLPIMNSAPTERAVGYTAATIGIFFVAMIIISFATR